MPRSPPSLRERPPSLELESSARARSIPAQGIVVNPGNLPCWRNYPLVAEIKKSRGLPTILDNDANAAALAEAQWGAAAGYSSVFYATIGTGIGTGIVLNGSIYHGRTGAAGEGGHVSIDYHGPLCPCGKRGCIEVLTAGPAVARRARERLEAGGAEARTLLSSRGWQSRNSYSGNRRESLARWRSTGHLNSGGNRRLAGDMAWQHDRSFRSRCDCRRRRNERVDRRMVRAYPPADTEMVGQLTMGRNSLRSRTVRRGFRHCGRCGSVCLREGHLTIAHAFLVFRHRIPG